MDDSASSIVVVDTNVFVAAGFRPRSASARVVGQIRSGRLRMVWHEQTRSETRHILSKIPPLSWPDVERLFREEDRCPEEVDVGRFTHISDPDDRKYAALAHIAGAILLTNDSDLLSGRHLECVEILTPAEFCDRHFTEAGDG